MPEELEDEFGDIIKKARAGLGLNPDAVAHETSIAVDDIIHMETYKLKPSSEQVRVIASALDLDGDRLQSIADGSWHPQPRQLDKMDRVVLERVRVPIGAYSSNCYILGSETTKDGVVIDPGGAVGVILDTLKRKGLTLTYVLVTHGHNDHIGGLSELVRLFPRLSIVVSPTERVHGPDVKHPEDGEEFEIGDMHFKTLATPGHTGGSYCYLLDGAFCFVGDTLFAGSVGGTSGIPEMFRQELESIKTKLCSLPDSTVLFPGHGPATTVGEEKRHNPFL